MEHGPLLYHRPLVYDARGELGRARHGSGSGYTDRKASGHARETRMSSKSRTDAAMNASSKRHEGSGSRLQLNMQVKHSPRSLKKATQRIYAKATAQRLSRTGRQRHTTEQSRDATTANASVGPVLLSRQSYQTGQDRLASGSTCSTLAGGRRRRRLKTPINEAQVTRL